MHSSKSDINKFIDIQESQSNVFTTHTIKLKPVSCKSKSNFENQSENDINRETLIYVAATAAIRF